MPRAASWTGSPSIKGSSESMRMALLTFSLIGLQFTWGIEMTYCTPYLLQLGLTKSRTSLVWIAGPISGLIMQPVVGVLADNSKSKYGRRRPFMLYGVAIVSACLITLGWTAEIVGIFFSDPATVQHLTVALAILSIYAADFAINAVQASCRSLIVDTLPTSKQQLGSAWASRMIAIGSLVGYGVGTLDLVETFGTTFGNTQFKQLTLTAALLFSASVGVTCWAVGERVLVSTGEDEDIKSSAINLMVSIFRTTFNLPDRIRAICWVQFWAWIGWFPFLFYSATWVGEVYFRYHPESNAKSSADALGEVGRLGSLSLVVFSVVTFAGSIALPWLVDAPEDIQAEQRAFTPRPSTGRIGAVLAGIVQSMQGRKPDLLTAWQWSHLMFAAAMIFAPFVTSLSMATLIVSLCGVPWAVSCWAPFAFMGIEINRLTANSSNKGVGRNQVPILSIPMTEINGNTGLPQRRGAPQAQPRADSPEVSDMLQIQQNQGGLRTHSSSTASSTLHLVTNSIQHHSDDEHFSDSADEHDEKDSGLSHHNNQSRHPRKSPHKHRPHHSQPSLPAPPQQHRPHCHRRHRSASQRNAALLYENATGETAGVYLGILNLFTTLPQLVGTFIATIVFAVLEPGISPELHEDATHADIRDAKNKPNGIAVCLAIGAISALGAAYASSRMRRLNRLLPTTSIAAARGTDTYGERGSVSNGSAGPREPMLRGYDEYDVESMLPGSSPHHSGPSSVPAGPA